MRARKPDQNLDLFRARLENILDLRHPLCRLAKQIHWTFFEEQFGPLYCAADGRPAKPIRLMVGVHYLKHAYNESDESVVERLLENPYWQYFCGFEYFVHELPVDPTSLVKWRGRVGERGLEQVLREAIQTGLRSGALPQASLRTVNVDTTVQEKNITHPTDAKLYHKMRAVLVREANRRHITLRQTYARKGKQALFQYNRLRHARQERRARTWLRKLKTYLGRVARDVFRHAATDDAKLHEWLREADLILHQHRNSSPKVYSVHEPDVVCIAKGKAHKKYEFGCKVGVVTTSRDNWVVGITAFSGNPYDGHTLAESLVQMERLTGVMPTRVYVDKGYRGHGWRGEAVVHVPGQGAREVSVRERNRRKRRSAIEPVIGHLKSDHRLDRNFLKGEIGDQMNALLAGAGSVIRKLLRVFFLSLIWAWWFRSRNGFAALREPAPALQAA